MYNSATDKRPNRLANEKSPYLKQHQFNPVNWYPWGDEAFTKAKEENKPIFLSVGYATCHWCHVMEHESFSDTEVANLMNEVFVNIKVDREERPDVDGIYMAVCQMLTGSGGWPLTVLMTPDRKPFFAGSYFPKESKHNKPGIKDIVIRTREVWAKHKDEITEQAVEITQQLNSLKYKAGVDKINQGVFRKGFYELASSYDELNGGFGNRPKFPIPHNFMFLLRYGVNHNSPEAIDMVAKTLNSMRKGGIWDHVGGGFHRYSTDSEWLVPHFEKMLYDEALLITAYTEAYRVTGDANFKNTAIEIINYVCRDLRSDNGAFYSAEDADSEGEEGKFYLWDIKEIREILIGDVEFFCNVFNIKEKGNYYDEVLGTQTGKNILHRTKSNAQLADEYGISEEQVQNRISISLNKLFNRRKDRIRPLLDNKILTDWNGLMISALTNAAAAFDNLHFAEMALQTIEFFNNNMLAEDFSLLHRFADGEAGITGMIDDYAFYIKGLLDYYEFSGDDEFLKLSENLTGYIIENFDDSNGGFFFTSINGEKLISRKKEIYDGALPSGNSIMLDNMLRLSHYTAKEIYAERSEVIISTFATALNNVPSAYTYFLCGLDRFYSGLTTLVILSAEDLSEASDLIKSIRQKFNPYINIRLIKPDSDLSNADKYIQNMKLINNEITCYVCSGNKCDDPISGIDNIRKVLNEKFGIKL